MVVLLLSVLKDFRSSEGVREPAIGWELHPERVTTRKTVSTTEFYQEREEGTQESRVFTGTMCPTVD